MESKRIRTSLDLNLNPFHHEGEEPKKEFGGDSVNFKDKLFVKEEASVRLAEELNRISSENKKLTEMLATMYKNYTALQSQLRELMMNKNFQNEILLSPTSSSRKRKADGEDMTKYGSLECGSSDELAQSFKLAKGIVSKVSTVYVRTDSSDKTLTVKDGYQWRKYGQKVTKDNSSPRAYFKCYFAPSCPVKKKVQRSAEDPTLLVVTYEGEHRHTNPSKPTELLISPIQLAGSVLPTVRSSGSTITFDLVQPAGSPVNPQIMPVQGVEAPVLRQILVQQTVSSLTRDPNFAAALAAAISGRIFDGHAHLENS